MGLAKHLGLARLCRVLILIAFASVPFRNVFDALLPGNAGLVAAELMLLAAGYFAVQVLFLHGGYRAKLRRWFGTLDVQLASTYILYVFVLSILYLQRSPALTVVGLGVYLTYPVLFFLLLLFMDSSNINSIVTKLVLYVYPVVAAGAIVGVFSGNPLVASHEVAFLGSAEQLDFSTLRAASFTGSSIHLGLYNALLLPLVLGYLMLKRDNSWMRRVWLSCVLLLGLISLMLSFSRGAWVQTFISLVVVCVLGTRSIKRGMLWCAGPAAVCGLLLMRYTEAASLYWMRLVSIIDWTISVGNVGRIGTWKTWTERLAESCFLGSGPASTGNAAVRFGVQSAVAVTESSYLKLAVELGAVGLALFVLLFCLFTARCFTLIRLTRSAPDNWLAVSIFAALVGLAVEMAVYQSIETQIAQAFLWFYMAAVAIMYREQTDRSGCEHLSASHDGPT